MGGSHFLKILEHRFCCCQWLPRDTLLKSCFCKSGHLRIPESKGCYDPIRRVVTLRDACFADYHCNDLGSIL
jgi:hypothetical protein